MFKGPFTSSESDEVKSIYRLSLATMEPSLAKLSRDAVCHLQLIAWCEYYFSHKCKPLV